VNSTTIGECAGEPEGGQHRRRCVWSLTTMLWPFSPLRRAYTPLDTLPPPSDNPSSTPPLTGVTPPTGGYPGDGGLGPPRGVTGNVLGDLGGYALPPTSLSLGDEDDGRPEAAAFLDRAAALALNIVPYSPEAHALVEKLTAAVIANQGTRRGPKLRAKLSQAIGAVVGALLKNWSRSRPRAVYRSHKASAFSDGPIGHRQFIAAMSGLVALGFVSHQPGYRKATEWEDGNIWSGKASRFWPSVELLRLAVAHAVTAAAANDQFKAPPPAKAPNVRRPVEVNSLKLVIGYRTGQSVKRELDASEVLGPDVQIISTAVEEANAFAATQDVRGCTPPRWKRVFTVNASLGGRWIAVGREGAYQTMPENERLACVTINGEPVVEVDVSASHLSIMHGLLGLELPDGDPYAFPGLSRSVVKAWITATLGKGSPVNRWARKAVTDAGELRDYDSRHVGRVICERYPFLLDPAGAVARPAELDNLKRVGPPEKLLTHRLMSIEAMALTGAMGYARSFGVLALPMHDGLIVPASGESCAKRALDGAYATLAKVRIKRTVRRAPSLAVQRA
jgi:hypothetical protein